MTPFKLEKFKAGNPAITRSGKKAYFIAHNPAFIENQRVCFIVEDEKEFFVCCEDGAYFRSSGISKNDLVGMATVKRTVWINLHQWDRSSAPNAYAYNSREDADDNALSDRIGNRAWPLEIEQ